MKPLQTMKTHYGRFHEQASETGLSTTLASTLQKAARTVLGLFDYAKAQQCEAYAGNGVLLEGCRRYELAARKGGGE